MSRQQPPAKLLTCIVCGTEIEFKPGDSHYARRQTCFGPGGTRSKCANILCSAKVRQAVAANRNLSPKEQEAARKKLIQYKEKQERVNHIYYGVRIPAPARKQTKYKSDVTDEEQSRIDRECRQLIIARTGFKPDMGRSLSREEIDGLVSAGKITPIDQIQDSGYYSENY